MFDALPLLEAMDTTLERGAFPELQFLIEFYHPHVMASEDAAAADRFNQICTQAQAGFEYEAEHGRWSLLKRDHPATAKLRDQGFYKDLFPEAA